MEFCVITPTAGLTKYATRSKRHMVLAQQYVKDLDYRLFYAQRRSLGEFTILDNGAYEGEYEFTTFIEAIRKLEPNLACLPDLICDGLPSARLSKQFLVDHHDLFPKTEWMFIPQGADLLDWYHSLTWYKEMVQIDPRLWIGLTRFLPTDVCHRSPLIRVDAAKQIKDRWPDCRIHCMGMANGNLAEMEALAKEGLISSIDSSAPVWRGWNGFDIFDYAGWDLRGTDVDFQAALPEATFRIDCNLEVVLGYCSN